MANTHGEGDRGRGTDWGVHLQLAAVKGPDEWDWAFSTIAGERADALIVFPRPMLFTERRRVVGLAAKHRLPAVYPWTEAITAGGPVGGARLRGCDNPAGEAVVGRRPRAVEGSVPALRG